MNRTGFWLMSSLALVAACSPQKEEQPQAAEVPTVHELMVQKIDVDADAIWTIGNAALNDQASIDPARMDDKGWQGLEQAATRMARDARTLGALEPAVVTRPGVKIADEGTPGAPSPAEITSHIHRDHDVFSSLAESLATHADQLAAAAKAKDHVTAGRLVNEMDGVCEACHLEFWYPEQKALVESILAKDAAAENAAGGNAAGE